MLGMVWGVNYPIINKKQRTIDLPEFLGQSLQLGMLDGVIRVEYLSDLYEQYILEQIIN